MAPSRRGDGDEGIHFCHVDHSTSSQLSESTGEDAHSFAPIAAAPLKTFEILCARR
jgi:hypothetical protein